MNEELEKAIGLLEKDLQELKTENETLSESIYKNIEKRDLMAARKGEIKKAANRERINGLVYAILVLRGGEDEESCNNS